MAFFNVDDQFHTHPKVRRAGLEAIGLWTVAGAWCRAYKSDGFVPAWLVDTQPKGKRLAAKLIEADLWRTGENDGEAGFWFHDWLDIQTSAEDTERQREQARERQRRRRAAAHQQAAGGKS